MRDSWETNGGTHTCGAVAVVVLLHPQRTPDRRSKGKEREKKESATDSCSEWLQSVVPLLCSLSNRPSSPGRALFFSFLSSFSCCDSGRCPSSLLCFCRSSSLLLHSRLLGRAQSRCITCRSAVNEDDRGKRTQRKKNKIEYCRGSSVRTHKFTRTKWAWGDAAAGKGEIVRGRGEGRETEGCLRHSRPTPLSVSLPHS
jgi:hypothetical protein